LEIIDWVGPTHFLNILFTTSTTFSLNSGKRVSSVISLWEAILIKVVKVIGGAGKKEGGKEIRLARGPNPSQVKAKWGIYIGEGGGWR